MWSNTARDYARGSGGEERRRRERHGPVAGGPGAGGEQRARRQAREAAALAGEVRLVGVAGGEGELREVGCAGGLAGEREEALEAEHPLQRLGAVADGVVEAAAQLALAETHVLRDALDRRPGRGRPPRPPRRARRRPGAGPPAAPRRAGAGRARPPAAAASPRRRRARRPLRPAW